MTKTTAKTKKPKWQKWILLQLTQISSMKRIRPAAYRTYLGGPSGLSPLFKPLL